MDPYDIEIAVQYRQLDGLCYAAMVAAGFIDATPDGAPVAVSGWHRRDGVIRLHVARVGGGLYGSAWSAIRHVVILRDGNKCVAQGCRAVDDLEVHHVRPLRLFAGDLEGANDLSNLVTLCRSCHVKADAEIRRAERSTSEGEP